VDISAVNHARPGRITRPLLTKIPTRVVTKIPTKIPTKVLTKIPTKIPTRVVTMIAAAALGAFGIVACSSNPPKAASPPATQAAPATSAALTAPPSPDALTAVLARLADPNVPSGDKVPLIEGASPDTAGTIDKFITALHDNGYLPISFAATNIAWSETTPTHVMATVTVNTAQQSHPNVTFPMEFTPCPGGWQLSRRTADMLLAMSPSPAPPAPGTPQPTPAPPAPPR